MRGAGGRVLGARGLGARCSGALVLGALVLGAGTAFAQPAITMDEAVRIAVERHPAIREAAARVDEARGLAQQAGTARNPMVGYLADDLGTGNGSPAGRHGAFVEVPIALGGRLGAAREAGDALVASRVNALDLARRQVAAEARTRWVAVATAARRLDVQTSLATLAEEGVDIAGKLFNVGLVDRADILDAEAAAAEARAHRDEAAAALEAAWDQLASIMGVPDLPRGRAPDPSGLPTLDPLDREAVRTRVMADSPRLEAARLEVARQQALITAAQRAAWPDLKLKGEAWFDRERGHGSGQAKGWGFGAEAGIRLPLFDRNAGQVLAASAAERAAAAALDRTRLAVADDFASAWAGFAAAAARATALQDEVLPRAEEAYRLYLENFQQMASPYPQVLMARERLIRVREEHAGALDAAWRAWVRILQLTGG